MRSLMLRSRIREGDQVPQTPHPAASLSPPGSMTASLGIGAILSLGGLGVAGAATIVAFFGIGLSVLIEHPVRIIGSEPSAATAPRNAQATMLPAAETGRQAPAPRGGTPLPPHMAGGSLASAAPTAPTNRVPTGVPLPLGPSPKTAAILAPTPAVRSSSPDTTTLDLAVQGPATPPAPVASPQPPQAGAKPPPPARVPAAPQPHAASPMAAQDGRTAATERVLSRRLSAVEITALLTQGDDAFRVGDLTSARLYYLRAFAVGEGRGALGIGASYDPVFLRRFHLWTQPADPAEAYAWYLRARNLGDFEAESRLAKLKVKSPH
jgi:hypothetical protein